MNGSHDSVAVTIDAHRARESLITERARDKLLQLQHAYWYACSKVHEHRNTQPYLIHLKSISQTTTVLFVGFVCSWVSSAPDCGLLVGFVCSRLPSARGFHQLSPLPSAHGFHLLNTAFCSWVSSANFRLLVPVVCSLPIQCNRTL